MSEEKKTPQDTAPTEEATETPVTEEETPKTEDPIEALQRELAEAQDKYLRMLAEYDNYRRRSQKEKETSYSDGVAETVKKLLPIADNIDRATQAEGDAESVKKGIEMIGKSLGDLLAHFGIEVYGKVGETFDPNLHNAVMHEEDPERGEGEITAVFQCGYKMGDKIIRFAMVKVAN